MATLVCFHAHPDDEAINTAGTMALAAAAGHRVVLVLATRGELGEPVPGVLRPGEALWERRVQEAHRSAEVLGVARVAFLGYRDSGMMGEPSNDAPDCFWQADVDEAAARLAAVLVEEGADVLTTYDDHGGYGHPDHIAVHRVGHRAAELAGVARVFHATMNRDHIARMMAAADGGLGPEEERPTLEAGFGSHEGLITHAVDVSAVLDRKRRAMQAHASQIGPDAFFLRLPAEAFAGAFGIEWYIAEGASRPVGAPMATDLLADLP